MGSEQRGVGILASAEPPEELAAELVNHWRESHPYKTFTFLAALLALGGGITFFLWRGWSANRQRLAQEAIAVGLLASQEQDRKRIAAELHDGLGQNLVLIKNRAELGLKCFERGEDPARHLKEISAVASQSLDETREIAHDLRPHHLDSLGLTKALKALINRSARAAGLRVTLDLEPVDGRLAADLEIHLYRIVQECLSNVIKHAAASEIRVALKPMADRLRVRIQDDGCGLPVVHETHPPAIGTGFGLVTIAERVRLLHGRHRWESEPGEGTTLLLDIPLTPQPQP